MRVDAGTYYGEVRSRPFVFSFVLAVMAMLSQAQFSLYVLLAGSAFTVIPVAYLETRRRT